MDVEEFFAAALAAEMPSYGELASTIYGSVYASAEEGLWWHMAQSNCERAAIVLNRLGLIDPIDEAEAIFRVPIDPKEVSVLAESEGLPKPSYDDLITVIMYDFAQMFGTHTPVANVVKNDHGARMLAQLIRTGIVVRSPDSPSGMDYCEGAWTRDVE